MTQASITATAGGGMSFVGRPAVEVYRATVIASALKLYARTGIKANRAYTPTAMLEAAAQITGQTFKGKDKYMAAHDALTTWARAQADAINKANSGKEGSQG